MADLKKKKKKKDASGSPNLVLVIFLILFIITSIVLGIFTYSGYAGQDEMKTELREAKAQAEIQKKMSYFYRMLYRDASSAIDDSVPDDELKDSEPYRIAFLDGTFKTGG